MSRLSLKNDFKDGEVLYGAQINTNNDATVAAVNDNYEEILKLQDIKADVSNVNNLLATKVDNTTFNNAINSLETTKANLSLVNTKADKSELEAKADLSYVNTKLNVKADLSYVNTQLNTKANSSALGDLSTLKTNNKSSAVSAINEIFDNGGGNANNIDNISITKNSNNNIQTVGVIDKNNENVAIKTWTGTKEEYDAIENKDANTLYYITDDEYEHELVSNKTTIINEESTDKQYPSAKAVYTSIKDISGGSGGMQSVSVSTPLTGDGTAESPIGIGVIPIEKGGTGATDAKDAGIKLFKGNIDASGTNLIDTSKVLIYQSAAQDPQSVFAYKLGSNIWGYIQSKIETAYPDLGIKQDYTAGENIEITEDNIINNTIPFSSKGNRGVNLGTNQNLALSSLVSIGNNVKNFGNYSIVIGGNAKVDVSNTNGGIAIGFNSFVGGTFESPHNNSIVLGRYATSTSSNQFVLGSTQAPINKMNVVTSEGTKEIATVDQITELTTLVEQLQNEISALKGE